MQGSANPICEVIMQYNVVFERRGDWWIGWLPELQGANAQEKTLDSLVESLRVAACDILELAGIADPKVEIVLERNLPDNGPSAGSEVCARPYGDVS